MGAFLVWAFKTNLLAQNLVSEGMVGVYTADTLPPQVTDLLSDSLVKLDKNGYPKPELVDTWQLDKSGTTYIFKLKNNLYWNDGSKVKSSDINLNLPDDVIVSYPDDQTLQFKLKDPFAPFPTLLTDPILKSGSFVGIGKYTISQTDSNQSVITKLTLKPLASSSNNLPTVVIRFYPDEATAQTAFEIGEVDSLIGLSNPGVSAREPGVSSKKKADFDKIVAIFYNTKDHLLSDKNIRKALNSSTNRPSGEEPAVTSISPHSWAFNSGVEDVLGNSKMAADYLSKGHVSDSDSLVLTTTPSLAALGQSIVDSWQKLGIKTTLSVQSGVPQNFQALLIAEPIPSDPDQYSLWHSTQIDTNLSKYSFARVDKDLEDGREISDLSQRKAKYQDFQKSLSEDVPATFLYFPQTHIVFRNKTADSLNGVLSFQLSQY